jgi:general nucleoside transport system permease protein
MNQIRQHLSKWFKQLKNTAWHENDPLVSTISSVMAILIGLLFGFAIMLIVSPSEAVQGITLILRGGLNDGVRSIGALIAFGTPLLFTGLSVAFAYRTGLFNIGASGQLMIGALAAVFVGIPKWWVYPEGVRTELLNPLVELGHWHWVLAVLAAFIAGGLWGMIPGMLKAFFNVNEVVASIMLNYVAMFVNSLIINRYLINTFTAKAFNVAPSAVIPSMGLDTLLNDGGRPTQATGAIFIALAAIGIIQIILNRTVFGYELKAVGFNRDAARYAGMSSRRNIILSMSISGALAGLGGASLFLVTGRNLDPVQVILTQGFDGIAIALLGLGSPIGVGFAGLFFSSMKVGGQYLQLLSFRIEIIDIIISVIIYMAALSLVLRAAIRRVLTPREK